MPTIDPELTALPLDALADAALQAAKDAGASVAEFRLERSRVQQIVARDRGIEATVDLDAAGHSVRVIVDGSFGFAASATLTPQAAADAARQACRVARTFASLNEEPIELADEPAHQATWVGEYEIDPFAVATDEKVAWLLGHNATLLDSGKVQTAHSTVHAVKEGKYFASLAGARILQQRVRMEADVTATRVDPSTGAFEQMETSAPPVGRGWEWTRNGWGYDGRVAQMPELLEEKMAAPSVEPGRYDLVLHPTHLWLTIHESIGHATELDRVLGYEANYAGTSFATMDKLGKLQYGSPLMHVTGDRLVRNGLSTVGFDDEGVQQQEWDLIKDGVLVGYQLNRQMAQRFGLGRSNGCAFADASSHVPIQRMPNVSLQPGPDDTSIPDLIAGVDDGIYIEGDKSWSIDQQRYNFQFTGQRFWRIRGGKLAGMLKDVAYQATTTDFWNAMDALGGRGTYLLAGAFNCGKGQPGQIAPVSHGAPAARFRQINVLNTRAEAGR